MALITNLLTAALSKLIGEEISAWSPRAVRALLKIAIRCLPEKQRARLAEEWQSHLNEIPGTVGKLFTAAGLLVASCRIRMADSDDSRPAWMDGPSRLKQAYLKALYVIRDVTEGENFASEDPALGSLVQTLNNSLTDSWGPYEETANKLGAFLDERNRRKSKHKIINDLLDVFWYARLKTFAKPRYDDLARCAEQIDKMSDQVIAIAKKKREKRNAC